MLNVIIVLTKVKRYDMCGLVGIFHFNDKKVNMKEFTEMNRSLRHRGPDDEGIVSFSFSKNSIWDSAKEQYSDQAEGAVGFNRLSIIDLSENGHQPMVFANKNIILAFNGEIYNAEEYRKLLINKGYTFKSRTDTEIILYLYDLFGFERMLSKLNGMFALSIIDVAKKRFFLARDRMGIKPLYYCVQNSTVLFASEVKAFLFSNDFQPELSMDNIDEYSVFGYTYGRETILKNVHNVEPGEYLIIDKGNVRHKQYWQIYNQEHVVDMDYNSAQGRIRKHLYESLKKRLISDVRIGCQLSGGIDSSLITNLTSDYLKEYDLDSISIIFENENYSEEKWIDYVVEKTKVNNYKFTLTKEYFFENFKKAIWHYDFPLLVPNSLGIYLLAEKAKEHFTVFLSGDGADELLCGYERFYAGKILGNSWNYLFFNKIPGIKDIVSSRFISSDIKQKFNNVDWFISRSSYIGPATLKKIKNEVDTVKFMQKRRNLFDSGYGGFLKKAQRYELKTWLVDSLIRQDKMTMASSIENRVPFLDHNLVDAARKIPEKYFLKKSLNIQKSTKRILKDISLKYFDKKFLYRKKVGFRTPIEDFFGYGKFKEWVFDEIIPGVRERGIFKADSMEYKFNNLQNLNYEELYSLWILIGFEAWAGMYLDKKDLHCFLS